MLEVEKKWQSTHYTGRGTEIGSSGFILTVTGSLAILYGQELLAINKYLSKKR